MKELYPVADSYTDPSDYVVPFGFHFKKYEHMLYKKLKQCFDKSNAFKDIRRMWVVCGSGVVLSVLQRLLPDTMFLGVQVGRDIRDGDVYDLARFKLYKSSYKFFESYPRQLEINSVSSYDAKVFEFIETDGIDGDWMWNVAGMHRYLM
jgi:hypothetical protein